MSGAGLAVPANLSIEVLRRHIAPDATDAELAFFGEVCRHFDLSPFADQIVFIGRNDKRAGRKVHRHQITVAGRRVLAARTGRHVGTDGPVWCGPRTAAGELVWREVWDEIEPPYCARALVYVDGWRVPANGTAKWDEFAQFDSHGNLLPLWLKMPSYMLGKTAESMALRRAFADAIDPAIDLGAEQLAAGTLTPDDPDLAEVNDAAAVNAIDQPADIAEAVGAGWQPAVADQAAAHRAIALLGEPERDVFLAQWDIEDFGAVWPAGAVADALGLEVER